MTLIIDFGKADEEQGCHWLKDYREKAEAERATNPDPEPHPGYEIDMNQPSFQKLRAEGKYPFPKDDEAPSKS